VLHGVEIWDYRGKEIPLHLLFCYVCCHLVHQIQQRSFCSFLSFCLLSTSSLGQGNIFRIHYNFRDQRPFKSQIPNLIIQIRFSLHFLVSIGGQNSVMEPRSMKLPILGSE
jgi:hypothetical protein